MRSELLAIEAKLGDGHYDSADLRRQIALAISGGASAESQEDLLSALTQLTSDGKAHREEAAFILRCIPVPSLLSDHNASSKLERVISSLASLSLPATWNRLRIDRKAQTFEQYAALSRAHALVMDVLSPLYSVKGDLRTFIENRKAITHALRQDAIREYCFHYDIEQISASCGAILARIEDITPEAHDISYIVSECERLIEVDRSFCVENPHFLGSIYATFLDNAEAALTEFKSRSSSQFAAAIILRNRQSLLQKRYALHEAGREFPFIVPLQNVGAGRALNVKIQIQSNTEQVMFAQPEMLIGDVPPGEFSVEIGAMVLEPTKDVACLLEISWGEVGSSGRKSEIFEARAQSQNPDIDWSDLEFRQPYSTGVARGHEFIGRAARRKSIANKILRTPMESFFVTGQKRVGKTSLVIAACDLANEKSPHDVHYTYILWGQIANVDPMQSLKRLGEEIAAPILSALPKEIAIPPFSFEGSLASITRIADLALKHVPEKKFITIIDEFDEIHTDLYLSGPLAETLFANLRAITNYPNMAIALVGGENMPFIIDRQGQKLNKLTSVPVDYYSRTEEWADFEELVRQPSDGVLNWHDDAISELFFETNGNPYFAKIVCAKAYSRAVDEKDADITPDEVRRAFSDVVSQSDANSFSHLWQDGIFKELSQREPDILLRSRVLVAIGRTLRLGEELRLSHIVEHKSSAISADEVQSVLNDFTRRKILSEDNGIYQFVLPVFKDWLIEVGIARLSHDVIAEELAQAAQEAEDAAFVRAEEIVEVVGRWPTYQGRRIGTDDVRAWLDQVGTQQERRVLFNVLKHLSFFSEEWIRERLKSVHGMIRGSIPQFVQTAKRERRSDIVVVYVDGEAKSGQFYASRYAEENRISVDNVVSADAFSRVLSVRDRATNPIHAIVVIDDIVSTGRSLAGNLRSFIELNEAALRDIGKPIIGVALTATSQGAQYVRSALSDLTWIDFDLRVAHPLSAKEYAFGEKPGIWGTAEQYDRARTLLTDLGARISRKSPLGYGAQGLTVVFPDTCPNNTLPVLHGTGASRGEWRPLFRRPLN